MSLAKEAKKDIIEAYRTNDKDVGSSSVQIAVLTARINALTDHFKTHKHDFHSKVGLLRLVNKRRKMLRYLKSEDVESYKALIQRLGLRR